MAQPRLMADLIDGPLATTYEALQDAAHPSIRAVASVSPSRAANAAGNAAGSAQGPMPPAAAGSAAASAAGAMLPTQSRTSRLAAPHMRCEGREGGP